MKIVCLIENTSTQDGLQCEFGLSFYVETESRKVLFDMGLGTGALENARRLGIDLSSVDVAILSHGHYDHGGGLRAFLEVNDNAPVYVQEEAFGDHYSRTQQGYAYIGLDKNLEADSRVIKLRGDYMLDGELRLFTDGRGRKEWIPETNATLLVRREEGGYVRDNFPHEQNLLISSGGSHVLLTGCSHGGIVNIMEQCERVTGIIPKTVIGGFHLCNPRTGKSADISLLRDLSVQLSRWPSTYYTCHCTGQEAYESLCSLMPNRIRYISTGDELVL